MPTSQHFIRIDSFQLKCKIEKRIGRAKTANYLNLLSRLLSSKLSKSDFDKLCIATIGKENIHLHNALLRGIIKNVSLSKTPPFKRKGVEASIGNGFQRGRLHNISDCRFKDSKGKSQVTDVFSSGGRLPEEDGEEVEQSRVSPRVHNKYQPIEAPLGIKTRQRMISNRLLSDSHTKTCFNDGELPDTVSLKKKLEQMKGMEELEVTVGFTNCLNMGLDVFLKRLIKPCLELATSRSNHGETHRGLCSERFVEDTRRTVAASMVDFQVAMELNPSILGEDWSTKLEKYRLFTPEED